MENVLERLNDLKPLATVAQQQTSSFKFHMHLFEFSSSSSDLALLLRFSIEFLDYLSKNPWNLNDRCFCWLKIAKLMRFSMT